MTCMKWIFHWLKSKLDRKIWKRLGSVRDYRNLLKLNKYYKRLSVGTGLASKTLIGIEDVSEYVPECNASMKHKELSFQEFGIAFKMLKRNKVNGYGGLNGNIIIDFYDSIEAILFNIF